MQAADKDTVWSRWRYLPRMLRLLWESGPREMSLIALLAVVSGILPVLTLITMQRTVDRAVSVITLDASVINALFWLSLLMWMKFLEGFSETVNRWLGEDVRQRLKIRVQEQILAKAGRLPYAHVEQAEFYDQLHRAQQGVDNKLLMTLMVVLMLPIQLVTALGMLTYVGAVHGFFPLALLGGVLPLVYVSLKNFRARYLLHRGQTEPERVMHYLGDLMLDRQAAGEIRLFGLQNVLFERRQRLFRRLRGERLQWAGVQIRGNLLSMLLEQVTYALVITGVVVMVVGGRLTVGYVASFLSAAERFRDSVLNLVLGTTALDSDLRYIKDLLDYLDLAEEDRTLQTRVRPSAREGAPTVCFENVSFTYPSMVRPVLRNLSFTFQPGEHIALIGLNGAGKSTLTKLLLGLYQPTQGRITVNGVDLRKIDPSWWHSQVGAVFQDYMKYELTVRENILLGDLQKRGNLRAMEAAAAKSGFDQVVSRLPQGYETMLGKTFDEQGQDLSIGQWQKLALTRAYLRDASLLVLDEPTAALDAKSEVEIYKQFRDLSHGKSVLFISHRLGSARLAGRILVLENGEIVEQGTHRELMEVQGRYAELFGIQAKWYE